MVSLKQTNKPQCLCRRYFSHLLVIATLLASMVACGVSDQYKETYRLGYGHGLEYRDSLKPQARAKDIITIYGFVGVRIEEPDAFYAGFEDAAWRQERKY